LTRAKSVDAEGAEVKREGAKEKQKGKKFRIDQFHSCAGLQ
jgi:ribosome-associated protein YbcJ (S4-like RNA binding protein)